MPVVRLFVLSLLSLYWELVVIRWLSSEIRIFAYFKNIPLMACLFGLGMGMALASSKRDWSRWFTIGLMILTAIISLAAPLHLVHVCFVNPFEHYLLGEFVHAGSASASLSERLSLFLPGLIVLVGVFYLIALTFVGLGQILGQLLGCFRPLVGYTVNVLGSIVGILLFTALSFLSCPPTVWVLVGVVPTAWLFRKPYQLIALGATLALAFLFVDAKVIWSPYYRIGVKEVVLPGSNHHPDFKYGYEVSVNYDAMEGAFNNDPAVLSRLSGEQRRMTLDYYDTPYLALGDKSRSVLVLAAGTGNDVAAALRHGATDIDAVEIDPMIAKLGRDIHPEKPYSDPRVHLIVDDARAFLRRCNKTYDLIVFSYLDSHTAFSSMSSLRLDNYVYTKECFRDASRLLKKDGAMCVTFYCLTWWQLARVYHSLADGYGGEPVGVFSQLKNGPTFLVGPQVDQARMRQSGLPQFSLEQAAKDWHFSKDDWDKVSLSTDDWPFLFLREPGFSWTYFIGIVFTLIIGFAMVGRAFGKFTAEPTGRVMFLLGAAFMLIETKSITQMGLIAGTTWMVNACVITAVLVMILLANFIQLRFAFRNVSVWYGLLFAVLAVNWLLPISALNSLPAAARLLAGGLILSAPLLFAAMIFAHAFSGVADAGKALGMNLLGTLVGGVLEYFSMVFGINALNVLAACLYLMAYLCSRQRAGEAAPAALPESGS